MLSRPSHSSSLLQPWKANRLAQVLMCEMFSQTPMFWAQSIKTCFLVGYSHICGRSPCLFTHHEPDILSWVHERAAVLSHCLLNPRKWQMNSRMGDKLWCRRQFKRNWLSGWYLHPLCAVINCPFRTAIDAPQQMYSGWKLEDNQKRQWKIEEEYRGRGDESRRNNLCVQLKICTDSVKT